MSFKVVSSYGWARLQDLDQDKHKCKTCVVSIPQHAEGVAIEGEKGGNSAKAEDQEGEANKGVAGHGEQIHNLFAANHSARKIIVQMKMQNPLNRWLSLERYYMDRYFMFRWCETELW